MELVYGVNTRPLIWGAPFARSAVAREARFFSEFGLFVIANFVTKIKAGLLKVRVFMPEMLLDEILGNQMGKNAIFHV